ncbi:ES1 protein mitochondrial [Echinococcus multilocularis]|uniref:ES1 protein mitochondrial n=1 Tax=Echinococcus multilocularis TaxID=6211 RepID=A0A068YBX1_ECHMU|nr:ES1 protein mitochondrial [Echinococcus multilocularis]
MICTPICGRLTRRSLAVQRYFSLMSTHTGFKKVALILHGCGVFDGSEIHETTSMLVHLSKAGADVFVFAPNIQQDHVTDHSTGLEVAEKRNVLVESARISRGKVAPLSELRSEKFDALLIPGGFGAATTLSNFASAGASCEVLQDVKRVLEDFVHAKKPIGLCCIAPVLAARCLPGVHVTTGTDADTARAIKSMGAVHEKCEITEVCVDENLKVVTAPAYMCATATIADIFDNIGLLVKKVLSLTN